MRNLTEYIISTFGGKAVRRHMIENACKRFKMDAAYTVNYMISYGYLVRILKGLYYVKTVEEFKLKKAVDAYKVISLGMDELKINWYFGLYTALRLNGLTHEFSNTIFVLSDKIFRPKEVKVSGEKVSFIKLTAKIFGFGVIDRSGLKFSDLEKTILDFVYLSKYRSVPKGKIVMTIEGYAKEAKIEKIREYLKSYPKSVKGVLEDARIV